MADRYNENKLQLVVPDDPAVSRELLRAAAVALKVSRRDSLTLITQACGVDQMDY